MSAFDCTLLYCIVSYRLDSFSDCMEWDCVAVDSCTGQGIRNQHSQRRGHQEPVQVSGACEVTAHGASRTRRRRAAQSKHLVRLILKLFAAHELTKLNSSLKTPAEFSSSAVYKVTKLDTSCGRFRLPRRVCIVYSTNRERKCVDTIGTVLVPWAGHF